MAAVIPDISDGRSQALWIANGPRRVAVITGSRADYGHLRHVMTLLAAAPEFSLQIVVCGMHLAPQFGSTWREIELDGFVIDAKVDLQLAGDSAVATVKSTGLGMIGFADALDRLRPELCIILGDRYEMLAAGSAALLLGIPVAHLHGGELTIGAFDDSIRHALSKIAHLHFVAAKPYRDRVIQMGEAPERVFNVGAPGLDVMAVSRDWKRLSTLSTLDLPADARYLLVTLHPSTAQPMGDLAMAQALVTALESVSDRYVVLTGVNADPGHATVDSELSALATRNPLRVRRFGSLGSERYFAALKFADAVVGNSSSGLVEAPAFGTPTVNVGDRQLGRLCGPSVVNCSPDSTSIKGALARALDPAFREHAGSVPPPYGSVGGSQRLVDILLTLPASLVTGPKHFHDVFPTYIG